MSATPPTAYKIVDAEQWAEWQEKGRLTGSPVDLADGYIHLSAANQVAETAAKHFAGQDGLWLIEIDLAPLDAAVRWEKSRGGALFPHVYEAIPLEAVRSAQPLAGWLSGHYIPATASG